MGHGRRLRHTIAASAVVLSTSPWAYGSIVLYVNANSGGRGDGASWESAFIDLNEALTLASDIGGDVEVWVASGVYSPAAPGGSRSSTFRLANGVAVYGGFSGTESASAERDPDIYVTILSGDLNGDDTGDFAGNGENVYHVVTGSSTEASAVLDGFTITGGNANADASPDYLGGGLYNLVGSPTIANCKFVGNYASSYGGAVYNSISSPTFVNCEFTGNRAMTGGGAVCNVAASGAVITDCQFTANDASPNFGGAIYTWLSDCKIVRCSFTANLAASGGAIFSTYSSPQVYGSIFFQNAADSNGGAIYSQEGTPVISDCIFSGNVASFGGGLQQSGSGGWVTVINSSFLYNFAWSYGGGVRNNVAISIQNSLFWGNADTHGETELAQISTGTGSTSTIVDYSCIQNYSTLGGDGNFGDDPLLESVLGYDGIPGSGDENFLPAADSPLVDSGDNSTIAPDLLDLDGDGDVAEPVPLDAEGGLRQVDFPDAEDLGKGTSPLVDIGACELQLPPPACEGDVNGDGIVDPLDGGNVLFYFDCPVGTGDEACDRADQNNDGSVDPLDSGFIAARFGPCEG